MPQSQSSSPSSPPPLRLLIVSPAHIDPKSTPPFRPFLEAITGSKPSEDVTTFAGYTSHPPLGLRTRYYARDVSIWCDELPIPASSSLPSPERLRLGVESREDEDVGIPISGHPLESNSAPATLSDWKNQILSDEAQEVRAVIGGIILLVPISSPPSISLSTSTSARLSPQSHSTLPLVESLHALREAIEDESPGRDIASLVILQSTTPTMTTADLDRMLEKLEDSCLDEGIFGWDFIAWDGELSSSPLTSPPAAENGTKSARQRQDLSKDAPSENPETNPSISPPNERNEFGEKTGLQRVFEVLEGVDWSASPDLDDEDPEAEEGFLSLKAIDGEDDEDASLPNIQSDGGKKGLPTLDSDLQREMMDLKLSMLGSKDDDDEGEEDMPSVQDKEEDEESQIDALPALLSRVVAIREAGSEMSAPEREKFAKREIARIMREMG